MRGIKIAFIYCFYLCAIAIGMVSCAAKKNLTQEEVKTTQASVTKIETVKAPLVTDVLTIPELCPDTVKAVEFRRVFVRDTDTVIVEVRNDSLEVRIKQAERLLQEKEQQISLRTEEVKRLTSSTKSRTPLKTILGFLAVLIVFVVFPGIPRALNTFFGKLIRGGF